MNTRGSETRTPSRELRRILIAALLVMAYVGVANAAHASGIEGPREHVSIATLGDIGEHWVWVPDRLLQHSILYDGDSGEVMGMIDSSSQLTPKPPLLARKRGEIYSADLAYARGTRGERTDFVTIYDARTLAVIDEIVVPTEAGASNTSQFYAELLGERFVAVFNQFPVTSVSIVDVKTRSFVEEIPITGCSSIYPVDEKRFATLCGNGTALLVVLDDAGHKSRYIESERFFDVVKDPVVMSAGRAGKRWTFITYQGQVHEVDFAGDKPEVAAAWSLLSDGDRREEWRPGGLQFVSVNASTQRLYVIMHQGGPGTHKQAGPEIWVYDLASKQRVARFEPPNLNAAFLIPFIDIDPQSFSAKILHWLLPKAGVHTIVVSQDDQPLLFARNAELGVVAVLDAITGEPLRFLTEAGLAGPIMRVP